LSMREEEVLNLPLNERQNSENTRRGRVNLPQRNGKDICWKIVRSKRYFK
jgi:hypothetical protein